MDPNTATREQFTQNLLSAQIPANAHADYRLYVETHQALLDHLAHHDAMLPNIQQTYMTPAASKNKVYFMWDFVGRTLGFLAQVPPEVDPSRGTGRAAWSDVLSRTSMGKNLLGQDQTMLEQMVEMTYPDQSGQHPALGQEVLDAARALPS